MSLNPPLISSDRFAHICISVHRCIHLFFLIFAIPSYVFNVRPQGWYGTSYLLRCCSLKFSMRINYYENEKMWKDFRLLIRSLVWLKESHYPRPLLNCKDDSAVAVYIRLSSDSIHHTRFITKPTEIQLISWLFFPLFRYESNKPSPPRGSPSFQF